MNVIARYVLTAFNAIEILEIRNDIDDYIIFRYNNSGELTKKHRAKIRETPEGRAYFKSYNLQIPLDECVRV
jgi:hypothetical protein